MPKVRSALKFILSLKKEIALLFIINIVLYAFIIVFYQSVNFHSYNYFKNSHHYLEDPMATEQQFNFLRSMGQYDAQWYLKIADEGYPFKPDVIIMENKNVLDGLTYAFFPLYPITVGLVNFVFNNVELSAFVLSNFLMIINFLSLIFIVTKLYSREIAVRTGVLVFLFPFSIFFRSYFTEPLYLFILIWFAYFFLKNDFLKGGVLLGLLNITKLNGFLLNFVFAYYLWQNYKKGKVHKKEAITALFSLGFPFLIWMIYCYMMTGSFTYFLDVREAWKTVDLPIFLNLFYNIYLYLYFHILPFHSIHYSQLESVSQLFILTLLVKSYRKINMKFWLIAFVLWLSPLLVHDLTSFTRYQTVSFPIFLYLAQGSRNKFYLTAGLFFAGLLIVSIFFVNWHWIG